MFENSEPFTFDALFTLTVKPIFAKPYAADRHNINLNNEIIYLYISMLRSNRLEKTVWIFDILMFFL